MGYYRQGDYLRAGGGATGSWDPSAMMAGVGGRYDFGSLGELEKVGPSTYMPGDHAGSFKRGDTPTHTVEAHFGIHHRRMNPGNFRALRRALRRLTSFERAARRVYHFVRPRPGRPHFKLRRRRRK